MHCRKRSALILGLATLAVLAGVACDEDGTRSRLVITRVADPAWPDTLLSGTFLCDVRDEGDDGLPGTLDDVVYEDQVTISIANYAGSDLFTLQPEGPYGAVVIDHYQVAYEIPGEALEEVSGRMHMRVPTGQEVSGNFVLVTSLAKIEPPLSTLAGSLDELFGTAYITLNGHEETSGRAISVGATMQIHFADWLEMP